MNKRKAFAFILSIYLAVAVTGCSIHEVLSPEKALPENNTCEAFVYEYPQGEVNGDDKGNLKEYASFAEAYLDILMKNRLVLTYEQQTIFNTIAGEDLGDGKIAVLDVFGDETPELLYIYINEDHSDKEYPMSSLYLKIFNYSKSGGIASVFDDVIYPIAGGEHNYCVYITRDEKLMMFLCSSGTTINGAFWPVVPNQDIKSDKNNGFYYRDELAILCYVDGVPMQQLFMQYGNEISETQFENVAKEIMGNIDRVLFQGAVRSGRGPWLYTEKLWKDITPFEEECMTYAEATSWLEAQMGIGSFE